MDTEHIAVTEPVRRLEVFTGTGRRRTWRHEDKAQIVAEIATSGDSFVPWLAAMLITGVIVWLAASTATFRS